MGRHKFSQKEIDDIKILLEKKCSGNRQQQKEVRHKLRVNYEFNISDFNTQGQPFGPSDLMLCIKKGIISILDDATIQAMKEKHKQMKLKDSFNK